MRDSPPLSDVPVLKLSQSLSPYTRLHSRQLLSNRRDSLLTTCPLLLEVLAPPTPCLGHTMLQPIELGSYGFVMHGAQTGAACPCRTDPQPLGQCGLASFGTDEACSMPGDDSGGQQVLNSWKLRCFHAVWPAPASSPVGVQVCPRPRKAPSSSTWFVCRSLPSCLAFRL